MIAASPVRAAIELEHSDPETFRASWIISPDDPIFRGHYPGFSIYPGICLIESAHRVATTHAEANNRCMQLLTVVKTRFRRPVFPGDRISVDGRTIASGDGYWQSTATVQSVRNDGEPSDAARIQLRYGSRTR